MKRYLPLLIAMVMSAPIFAASPKMPVPGFKKNPNKVKRIDAKAQNESQTARRLPQSSAAPQTFAMLEDLTEREVTGIRLIAMSTEERTKDGGNTYAYNYTYSYGKYGFLQKWENDNGSYAETEYQWYVPGQKWSQKVVTEHYGQYTYVTTTNRTFYANGSVNTSKEYDTDNKLVMSRTFDENGNLIEETRGDETRSWVYFPYTEQWYESISNDNYKMLYTVEGNALIYEVQHLYNNTWVRQNYYAYYYDENGTQVGNLNIDYDYEGTPTYGSGSKPEISIQGSQIIISYLSFSMDTMDWVMYAQEKLSANFNEPWIYSAGEVRTRDNYYGYNNGNWFSITNEVYTWINKDIVKCQVKDQDYGHTNNYVRYYLVEDNKLDTETDFYYDESNGNYAMVEWDSQNEYDIYSYYNADGTLSSRIRVKGMLWQQWNGSAWVACTGNVTLYEGEDRLEGVFNSQGQLVEVSEYDNGMLDEKTEFTYIPNGYTYKIYEPDDNGVLYMYETGTYTLVNNIETDEYFYHDEDGEITYGYKNVENLTENYTIFYSYSLDQQTWEVTYRYASPITEVLPDGKIQTITRDFVGDEIVYVDKDITQDDYNTGTYYLERYIWDNTTQSWVGEYKREWGRVTVPNFEVIYPTEPSYFSDEYFVPANLQEGSSASQEITYNFDYVWDPQNNDWVLSYGSNTTFTVTGNTMVKEITDQYSETNFDYTTQIIKVDNSRRILSDITTYRDPARTTTKSISYTYDSEGYLINRFTDDPNSTYSENFTYGEITYVTDIEEIAENAVKVIVSGKKVTVAGDALVEIFNMQGQKVAEIKGNGSVSLPSTGVYVIKYEDKAEKVLVK
ncbi:MAG: hypothetical protein J1F16_09995 [Muribaculaceae bacterium]|nr:hypothetical protein [Muribaculaceae bacterium]